MFCQKVIKKTALMYSPPCCLKACHITVLKRMLFILIFFYQFKLALVNTLRVCGVHLLIFFLTFFFVIDNTLHLDMVC